jgi:hypothetical protein
MKRCVPLGLSCLVLGMGLFSVSQLISKEKGRTVIDSIRKGETYLFILASGEVIGEVLDCSDLSWIRIHVMDRTCQACGTLPIKESWINLQYAIMVSRIDVEKVREREEDEKKKQFVPPDQPRF